MAARFARYRRTNGYNALINARQFGIAASWPMDYDEPDVVYDTTLPLTVGEVALELHHARGETDDHTWVWWAERRILWTGDQFIWVAPNAGNPQKVQRYAADWAVSLRAMSALEPELLIPGHGVPIFGRARVDQALARYGRMAGDARARDGGAHERRVPRWTPILAEVRPPAHLAARPYLQAVYDEPEYVVRNIWRLNGGWWDGIPSHLKPAGEAALGREVARLAGGVAPLVARAQELAAAGDLALAGHLIDWAVAAEPDNRPAHAARARDLRGPGPGRRRPHDARASSAPPPANRRAEPGPSLGPGHRPAHAGRKCFACAPGCVGIRCAAEPGRTGSVRNQESPRMPYVPRPARCGAALAHWSGHRLKQ